MIFTYDFQYDFTYDFKYKSVPYWKTRLSVYISKFYIDIWLKIEHNKNYFNESQPTWHDSSLNMHNGRNYMVF